MKKIIAIDLSSGDLDSIEALNAAIDFSNSNKDWKIKGYAIEEEIINKKNLPNNLEIIKCTELVGQEDSVMDFRRKDDSTLSRAINVVKDGEADGVVSAAASGPLVAGSFMVFRSIEGLKPAYAALASSVDGQKRVMLDVGANINADAKTLNKYATMGSEYIKALGISKDPIVKQLNIGEEDKKGTPLQQEAFKLLSNNEKINFQGNIEPNLVLSKEKLDVIVTEAYSGNILLKSYEGCIRMVKDVLKESRKTSILDKFGFVLTHKFRKKLKIATNSDSGGAIVLGLNYLIIKSHGSSKSKDFLNSIETAKKLIEENLIPNIKEAFNG